MPILHNTIIISENSGEIVHVSGSDVIEQEEVNYNNITIWKKQKGTPHTLTFKDTSGWIRKIVQGSFDVNEPKIEYRDSYETIFVKGRGLSGAGGSTFASGGYYIIVNTMNCPYVDVVPGLWFSDLSTINLGGKCIYELSGNTKNIPIDPNKSYQELFISLNNGGDTYNEKWVSIKSLYFHN